MVKKRHSTVCNVQHDIGTFHLRERTDEKQKLLSLYLYYILLLLLVVVVVYVVGCFYNAV